MEEVTYSVIVEKEVIARDMTLTNALTLAQALFDKWYNEKALAVTIQRNELEKCCVVDTEKDVVPF